MQVFLNPQIAGKNPYYNLNKNNQYVSFTGKKSGLEKDTVQITKSDEKLIEQLEANKKMNSFFNSVMMEFADRIDMEKAGEKVEMPNCLMVIGKDKKLNNKVIDWVKRYSDCNQVYLTNENNEKLMDNLWDEMQNAQKSFQKTKQRTLIHVDGLDRLINPKINTLDSIDGLKDIMARCAEDFGATLVFDTKDTSQLAKEAIQPQRVAAKFVTEFGEQEFDGYDKLLKRKDEILGTKTFNAKASTPQPEIKKAPEPIHQAVKNTAKPVKVTKNDEKLIEQLEANTKMNSLYKSVMTEFADRVDMEKAGEKVKMPNCLMVIGKDKKLNNKVIDWVKRYSDCNQVYLTNENNEKLMDNLWDEMQNAQKSFQKTKQRTLIHVDGLDRLINPSTNGFKQIEWMKDIMTSCAEDFGATLVFDAKDTSQLAKEAIQPQRVAAKFVAGFEEQEFDGYDKLLKRKDEILGTKTFNAKASTPQPEVKKAPEPIHQAVKNTAKPVKVTKSDEKLIEQLEANTKMNSLYKSVMTEFADRIDMEHAGEKVKMPNCLMVIGKDKKLNNKIIDWIKRYSDCNQVYVANENNEQLINTLWDEMRKAQKTFQNTKQRTLIHVEGFDRVINPKIMDMDNIDNLKDIMARCADEYGSTLVFDTKDTSQLTKEAIQPHRVAAKFVAGFEEQEFDGYDKLLKRKDEILGTKTFNAKASTPQPEVKKAPEPARNEELKQPKSSSNETVKEAKIEPKTKAEKTHKKPEPKVDSAKSSHTSSRTYSNTSSKTPKSKIEDVAKNTLDTATETAKSSKGLKLIAGIGAAVAAVTGILYYNNKKNNNQDK